MREGITLTTQVPIKSRSLLTWKFILFVSTGVKYMILAHVLSVGRRGFGRGVGIGGGVTVFFFDPWPFFFHAEVGVGVEVGAENRPESSRGCDIVSEPEEGFEWITRGWHRFEAN